MTEYIAFDETELSQGIKELIARERAEERRATVERIRKAMFGRREIIRGDVPALKLHEVLEQEANR